MLCLLTPIFISHRAGILLKLINSINSIQKTVRVYIDINIITNYKSCRSIINIQEFLVNFSDDNETVVHMSVDLRIELIIYNYYQLPYHYNICLDN